MFIITTKLCLLFPGQDGIINESRANGTEPSDRDRVGGIAQLGERLNGIQEVCGSIPHISTRNKAETLVSALFF